MNFAQDTFESVYRRKKLAAWLGTLRGPAKLTAVDFSQIANAYSQNAQLVMCAALQNAVMPRYVGQQNAVLGALGNILGGRQ